MMVKVNARGVSCAGALQQFPQWILVGLIRDVSKAMIGHGRDNIASTKGLGSHSNYPRPGHLAENVGQI